jgi:hypothetical protein
VKSGKFFPQLKKKQILAPKKNKTKINKPWSNSVDSNLDEVETLNNVKMSLDFRPLHNIHMHIHDRALDQVLGNKFNMVSTLEI